MFKSGYVLDTPDKIKAAMFNKTPVDVWHKGGLVDYGGLIEKYVDGAVKINGFYYLTENHEFRIR